jgi:hypothetical protein
LDQVPFDLPVGWTWARFPELGTFGRGKSKHRPRNDPTLFEGGTHLLIQTGDRPRLLSDNGPSYLSAQLGSWLEAHGMTHTRGKPYHPMTQGKIERYHRSMKNQILLENYYLPGQLEQRLAEFVDYYNLRRYHESLNNLTPADVYFGRAQTVAAYGACRASGGRIIRPGSSSARTVAKAQGHLPTLRLPACRSGGATHQPDCTRLGELLCYR